MPGWQQGVGGQAVYHDGEVVTHDGEVVTHDDSGGWLALSLRENGAAWVQTASWDGVATEAIPSTAEWEQGASWESSGDVDNPASAVDATGTWSQSASWAAVGVGGATPIVFSPGDGGWYPTDPEPLPEPKPQAITATAAFAQTTAHWIARAEFQPIPVAATARFEQGPAQWASDMDVNDDEALLLSDILELVA